MTASKTTITNWAMTMLGADRITNPGDDSERAQAAAEIYDNVVAAELRRNIWKFALLTASVGEELPAPPAPWSHRYPLPGNLVRLVEVGDDPLGCHRWAIEGRHILTDLASPLRIRFVRDNIPEQDFDALFVEVIACKMALDLAMRIRSEDGLLRSIDGRYSVTMREARRIGAIELPPSPRRDEDPWVQSRLDGHWIGSIGLSP